MLLAHYRYHLYKHHYPDAERFARGCLAQVTAKLALPSELLATTSAHADFTADDPQVRFWLWGMQALAYVLLRQAREDDAKALLRKVIELDPSDQTKSALLLSVIENAERAE